VDRQNGNLTRARFPMTSDAELEDFRAFIVARFPELEGSAFSC
jgi:hypothetical protein